MRDWIAVAAASALGLWAVAVRHASEAVSLGPLTIGVQPLVVLVGAGVAIVAAMERLRE